MSDPQDAVPSSMRELRACMLCSLIKVGCYREIEVNILRGEEIRKYSNLGRKKGWLRDHEEWKLG